MAIVGFYFLFLSLILDIGVDQNIKESEASSSKGIRYKGTQCVLPPKFASCNDPLYLQGTVLSSGQIYHKFLERANNFLNKLQKFAPQTTLQTFLNLFGSNFTRF